MKPSERGNGSRSRRKSGSRPPTLADVARRAGVSITTASFVVNNRPISVTEETRERVLTAVRELHYTANAHVQALRRQRSQTLGVHLHDYKQGRFLEDPVTDRIMGGISEAARGRLYHLLLYTGMPDYEGEAPAGAFLDRRVDGLVLVHAPEASRLMADLAELPLPCVVVFNRHAPAALGSVDGDNVGAMRKGVEHLVSLGHRRIAHLTWSVAASNRVDRCTGFMEALKAFDLPRGPGSVAAIRQGEDPGVRLRGVLEGSDPPSALFCFNDTLAIWTMQALAAMGRRVPEDISVIGFDDISLAAMTTPPLTTIRQPLHEMGRLAAAALVDMIEGKPASELRCEVPLELVARGSTGRPA